MYHEETSEAPKIIRVETDLSIRFKAKDGIFDIYDRESKTNKQVKEVTIVPVNDSRFTIKAAQNDEGSFIFSAMYRSTKQNIVILQSTNGKVSVVKQGTYEQIKDANLKYTRVMYCIFTEGKTIKRAEFDLQGIGLVQWWKIRTAEKVATTIKVSADKSFKTPKGQFYEMVAGASRVPTVAEDTAAGFMAENVADSFKSFDANYEYRKLERSNKNEDETEKIIVAPEEEDIKLSDIPF